MQPKNKTKVKRVINTLLTILGEEESPITKVAINNIISLLNLIC